MIKILYFAYKLMKKQKIPFYLENIFFLLKNK